MNRSKNLITVLNVPYSITLYDLYYELVRLMQLASYESREISGIMFIDSRNPEHQYKDCYILMSTNERILHFREICKSERGKMVLYILNEKLEIKFPDSRQPWFLKTMKLPESHVSTKVIKIKKKVNEDILNVYDMLPSKFQRIREHPRINSIVITIHAAFITFYTPGDALETINYLEGRGISVEFAKTCSYPKLKTEEDDIQSSETRSQTINIEHGEIDYVTLSRLENSQVMFPNLTPGNWYIALVKKPENNSPEIDYGFSDLSADETDLENVLQIHNTDGLE